MNPLGKLKKLKAVLFDMDGVIVDGMPFHLRAWSQAFATLGIEVTDTDIYIREGMDGQQTVREIAQEKAVSLNQEEIERTDELKNRLLNSIFRVRFIPGSLRFISRLKKLGLKLALVTGTRRQIVEKILKQGLPGIFDVVVTAETVERKKPDPAPYLKAVEALGVNEDECLVIENSPAGITSARRAGLLCIALTTSLPEVYLKDADAVFHDFQEVSELFKNRG